MKTYLIVATLALFLCSCYSTDTTEIEVGPYNTVSWEDAKTIIRDWDVVTVDQDHALHVTMLLKDGTRYQATEPEIDDVIRWVEACGKRDSISIMTE